MASVKSLSDSVQQQLASALSATLPEAAGADPLLRRSDRADFQANGILALAKKAKANPRELATQVVSHIATGAGLIKDVEVSGPGFLNITIADRAITETLAARAAESSQFDRNSLVRMGRSSVCPSTRSGFGYFTSVAASASSAG